MYFQTLRVHMNYFLGHVCLEFFTIFILKKTIRPQTLNVEKKKLRMAVKKSKSLHTCVTVPRYMYVCPVLNN